ncbi:discoidin domain-containing protein [Puia dinghuensis]|uniref:T9SS C-terminal target domain-containing protein n=1 Tax=Puia dinghuensis TaxID=1792502 RepID=A0A8J2XU71_9BACT|nr:discoidin domain-containing protein [Puia dinghuensis]GGB10035.1 hypothetical protein GCM10011511_36950 [Puia dinghuensis]
MRLSTFCPWALMALALHCVLSLHAQVNISTLHINNQRTGWNDRENSLNTKNVKPGSFGKLFSVALDDEMYAEPLVVRVNIPGIGTRNVLYAATVNNTVYAYDADSLRAGGAYWSRNFTPSGYRPPINTDIVGACYGQYSDILKMGIVGTPVIDTLTNTMYFVARSISTDGNNTFVDWLHAVDILTGADRKAPVLINPSVAGTGDGSSNGTVPFNPMTQNQRGSLMLLNGIVYIPFASHCDLSPYHGWYVGYDTTTLSQQIVYNTTPDGSGGGIWGAGNGPAADAAGNIYMVTGNGTIGVGADPTNNRNRAESMIKLTPSGNTLSVVDYFAPYNYDALNRYDLDFGSSEILLIPGLNRVLAGCKDGNLYLADVNNLGQWNSVQNNNAQTIPVGTNAHFRTSFGYYHGTAGEYVYIWPENTALKQFPVNRTDNNLDVAHVVTSGIQGPIGNNGANISTSSNGSVDSTAIVWITHSYNCDANHQLCPGIVRAVNGNDATQELWNSNMEPGDSIGLYAKMSIPTVANGKLYVASWSGSLSVYGLTNNAKDTCVSSDIALNFTATSSSVLNTGTPAWYAFDGNTTGNYWESQPTNSEWLSVDLGQPFNLCRVAIYWATDYGKDYDIQVSNDASTWTTVASVRGNSAFQNFVSLQGTGRYVRFNGITSGTSNGYGIYEMMVYGAAAGNCPAPTNLQATNIQKNSATLTWDAVPNATGYSIQYKDGSTTGWTTVTSTTNSVQVSALSCSSDYDFQVAVVCSGGLYNEYSTPVGFSMLYCSASCSTLPTRWTQTDVGSVGVAGQACYDGASFTLQGSGADIGGTADAFRFAYVSLTGNDYFIARVVTQDATDANNKAGIMVRSTLNANSPNAFVGITSSSGAFFQTRSTFGGNTTSTASSGAPAAPYWVKLVKSGTNYSGFISPDGLTWTQVGATADLGFGAGTSNVYAGLAITSHDNSVLSTATMDNYSQVDPPLPVQLVSFTGQLSGQSVLLRWTTAQEQGSDYFAVEKSADGAHFNTIATVLAAGNSNSERLYSATDANPIDGINYYRLRLVDQDGKFAYSPVVLVHYGKQTAPVLFPNPASSYFTLMAGTQPITEVRIYDLSGRMALQLLTGTAGPTLTLPCSKLSAGIYIVEIRTAGGRYIQKLIKQ